MAKITGVPGWNKKTTAYRYNDMSKSRVEGPEGRG